MPNGNGSKSKKRKAAAEGKPQKKKKKKAGASHDAAVRDAVADAAASHPDNGFDRSYGDSENASRNTHSPNKVIIDPFRAASGDKVAACFANNASSQYFLKKKNRQVPAITRALVDELPLEVLRLCRVTLEKDGSLERIGLDLDITQLGFSENLDEKGQQTVRAFAHIAQQRLIPSNTSASLHLNPSTTLQSMFTRSQRRRRS